MDCVSVKREISSMWILVQGEYVVCWSFCALAEHYDVSFIHVFILVSSR